MSILLIIIIFLSVLLEGTITTLPMVFVALLMFCIVKRGPVVFFLAFVSGIVLDIFILHPVGTDAIFLLIFCVLVLMYQKKYEIDSYPFVMVSGFVGSLIYLIIFRYQQVFLQAGITAFLGVLLFGVLRFVQRIQPAGKSAIGNYA